MNSNKPAMALYDDAELTALAIVREAVTEDASPPEGYSYSKAVNGHLLTMQERHGPAGLTAVAAALGRGLTSVAVALSLIWWPGIARLVRGEVQRIRERPHVEAARAIGVSPASI